MKIDKQTHTTRWLPVGSLDVRWVQSQREMNEKWVSHLVENFDPDMFGVLTVSPINGDSYHVIDGNHRRCAVDRLFGASEKVPCNVVNADTPAKAASIFNKMNTHRRKVDLLTTFKIRVVAGEPDEAAVNGVIYQCGLSVGMNNDGKCIRAVGACMDIYRRHGRIVLRDVLRLIQAIWPDTASALDGQVLKGFAEFIVKHPKVNHQTLIEKVASKGSPERLMGAARQMRDVHSINTPQAVVLVVEGIFNKGRKVGRL